MNTLAHYDCPSDFSIIVWSVLQLIQFGVSLMSLLDGLVALALTGVAPCVLAVCMCMGGDLLSLSTPISLGSQSLGLVVELCSQSNR